MDDKEYQQHLKMVKTTKTVDGVGTYTVAPDGTVTFKPVPGFVGKSTSGNSSTCR